MDETVRHILNTLVVLKALSADFPFLWDKTALPVQYGSGYKMANNN